MFKKQYSIISQVFQRYYIENGEELQISDWREMPYYVCYIGTQLKPLHSGLKCDEIFQMGSDGHFEDHRNTSYGWHKDEMWFNKKKQPMQSNIGYSYMTFYLPDGAWVNFNCSRYIFIDVNGNKKPNTVGRDIFYFLIPKTRISPNFFDIDDIAVPNSCEGGTYYSRLTPENYEEDCKNGIGWGCSPLYILE